MMHKMEIGLGSRNETGRGIGNVRLPIPRQLYLQLYDSSPQDQLLPQSPLLHDPFLCPHGGNGYLCRKLQNALCGQRPSVP